MGRSAPGRTTPAAYAKTGREPGTTSVVVCLDDSHTQGTMGASYVASLASRPTLRGHQLVNAGTDAHLAWNVLQRLDEVIACEPDGVILLVGSNDIIGAAVPGWEERYRRQQRIPRTPTLDWYVECVDAILTRLQTETTARVAVLDIPMLGEDLDTDLNNLVRRYNAALAEVAARHDVPCLRVHDRLAALLPADHQPQPFRADPWAMIGGLLRHLLLRRSWMDLGRRHGLVVLTDHVHPAEPGAQAVADVVEEFLTTSAPPAG